MFAGDLRRLNIACKYEGYFGITCKITLLLATISSNIQSYEFYY